MTDDSIIATLNELIAASKDGEKDFAVAAKNVHEPELARVFREGETSSRAAIAELQDQVRLLGGTAEQEGSMKAAAHRGWICAIAYATPVRARFALTTEERRWACDPFRDDAFRPSGSSSSP